MKKAIITVALMALAMLLPMALASEVHIFTGTTDVYDETHVLGEDVYVWQGIIDGLPIRSGGDEAPGEATVAYKEIYTAAGSLISINSYTEDRFGNYVDFVTATWTVAEGDSAEGELLQSYSAMCDWGVTDFDNSVLAWSSSTSSFSGSGHYTYTSTYNGPSLSGISASASAFTTSPGYETWSVVEADVSVHEFPGYVTVIDEGYASASAGIST